MWYSAGGQCYRRVSKWRLYESDYLDYFGVQLKVVSIDDTDINPGVSTDILHTLRIFLDHPRSVTIIAGDAPTKGLPAPWASRPREKAAPFRNVAITRSRSLATTEIF
jgi:hypothetical protein